MKFSPVLSLLIILCFFPSQYSNANTFIVTSNADSGPGTLREAIQNAAVNGTSVIDSILFNLPDISRNGRTIKLDSSLPNLSSHIFIDGTSQNGTPFGISDARVQIENSSLAIGFTCFTAVNITGVEIYGLYLKAAYSEARVAMQFRALTDMRFGAPGRGNMITGFYFAFYSDLYNNTDPTSDNISFQSNLMGIDESGDTANFITYNFTNFYIKNIRNLTIGGLGNKEGNLLCDGNLTLELFYTRPENFGYLKIEGNKIATDRTGLKRITAVRSSDIHINGYNDGTDYPEGTTDVNVEITNNICSGRIYLFKIKNYFRIKGNRFGVGSDNIANIGNEYQNSLSFQFCGQGIVGGKNNSDKNYIAYADGYGIDEFHCGNITISQNSFFCNTLPGIVFHVWPFYLRPKPFVTINAVSTNLVSGTALPKSVIELFYDDACPGCEGKTYIATTTADINGNWQYNGVYSGGIVATATDTLGATSEFSTGTINTDSIIIKNATCGRNNGAVKKARVVSGTNWYWEDDQGNIVGHDTDLVNVAPGKYKFVATIGGNECKAETILFEVKNIDKPAIDTSLIKITHPSCGISNGMLKNEGFFNDSIDYRWLNNANLILCNDFKLANPFNNLAPADYYLNIRLKEDSTCFKQYGPFFLINQSGPLLKTDLIQINNSTCNNANGAINNISYQNAIGNIYIAWEDITGKVISNLLDLKDVSAGKYRLKFKDGSDCDTIVTSYYNVRDTGSIHIDSTGLNISSSGCTAATGSISGIKQTGAEQWQWVNTSSNTIISNNLNPLNIPPGTYQLLLNNHFACNAFVGPLTINQAGFIPIAVNNSTINNASCHIANGAILTNQFSKDTTFYHFLWKDSNTNIIGNYHNLLLVDKGNYSLYAIDSNGCENKIFTAAVQQLGEPVFDYHLMQLRPDTCNAHVGSIKGLQITGGTSPYTWKWTNAANTIISNNAFSIGYLQKNSYFATVSDQNNCTVTSTPIALDNVNKIALIPAVTDQFIPRNTTTIVQVNNPTPGMYELLDDASLNSMVLASSNIGVFQTPIITADRSFYIRYSFGDCASELSKINIKVFDSTIIFVPNAFTPNNDGINDKWHVKVQGKITSFSISIFNRWGAIVYSSNDINNYWDGTLKGTPVPHGTFVYMINAKDYNNKNIYLKGFINIIR